MNLQDILNFKNQFDLIGINVGGCAVLLDHSNNKYYFIERPEDNMYIINGCECYSYINKDLDFDKMELIFKYNIYHG